MLLFFFFKWKLLAAKTLVDYCVYTGSSILIFWPIRADIYFANNGAKDQIWAACINAGLDVLHQSYLLFLSKSVQLKYNEDRHRRGKHEESTWKVPILSSRSASMDQTFRDLYTLFCTGSDTSKYSAFLDGMAVAFYTIGKRESQGIFTQTCIQYLFIPL